MKNKVDYKALYEAISNRKGHCLTASQLAFDIGVERIYGATMAKLVREGKLEPMPAKGFYRAL